MNYLIYGNKEYLIKRKTNEIKKSFLDNSINSYDLDNTSLKEVIDDAQTISLFSEKKLIICNNANVFTSSSKESDILEPYLNNPNPDTTIIFTLNNEKIDRRKKITKLIDKKGKIFEFNENVDTTSFIKEQLKDYKISQKDINLLKERVGNNIELLHNEIETIKIYKEDKNITKEDILNLTTKNIDTNIFKLIDYIILNNKDKALEIYYELLKQNEEPLKIIIILANQFRIMYQAKELLKKGLSEKDIAETLKIHPYRVKLALQNSRKYESKLLLSYLNELAKIDIDIKTGKANKDLALELFILKK
ncbi:MAG: DNA polymerase III subunit delta [Bacilli bacterium]|nr:DNA polymerase III subunit delta [Bacilli bacterium]